MMEEKIFQQLMQKNIIESNIKVLKMVLDFSKSPGNNQYDVDEFINKLIDEESDKLDNIL